MLACFQSHGNLLVCWEAVNSSRRQWEMGSAATLRMREGTLSGPDALFSLTFISMVKNAHTLAQHRSILTRFTFFAK